MAHLLKLEGNKSNYIKEHVTKKEAGHDRMGKNYTHEKEPSELVIKYVHKLKEISWYCDFEKTWE